MKGYRCYFMSGDSIQAVNSFECLDDAEVISKGWTLLESRPQHPVIEIWEGKRLVVRLTKNLDARQATESIVRLFRKVE